MKAEYTYGPAFDVTDNALKDFQQVGYIIISDIPWRRKSLFSLVHIIPTFAECKIFGDFRHAIVMRLGDAKAQWKSPKYLPETSEDFSLGKHRNIFDEEELRKIKHTVEGSDALLKHVYRRPCDDKSLQIRMVQWKHPGNDVTGIVARSEKVAGICEKLLGGEVYHYHSKLIMKDAHTGGQFAWHQDYGFWYQDSCLFPDMMSVFLPLDPCMKENGCLQILPGTHLCGRMEHSMIGGALGADHERVRDIAKQIPEAYVELNPGDALFFHCNLLHKSNANPSPHRRWVLISAYNRDYNSPASPCFWPSYTKLNKVPDSTIRTWSNFTDMSGKGFRDPQSDKNITLAGIPATR